MILAGCAKKVTPPDPVIYGLDYFPVNTGHYIIYDADSTVYNDLPVDTVVYRFRLREKIIESFVDNEGQLAYKIERSVKIYDPARSYDDMPWRIRDIWMLNASDSRIQISEGNKRYTKLIFPVVENKTWNGNIQNTDDKEMYSYEYIDRQEKLNNVDLERVLKVKQRDFKTLISYEGSSEKYAAGIGLVAKESAAFYSNTIIPGVPIENRIEQGYIYKQNIVTHGTD